MKLETHGPNSRQGRLDKGSLRELMAQVEQQAGFVRDPNATAEAAQAAFLAAGIRPEDCVLTRELARQRERRD